MAINFYQVKNSVEDSGWTLLSSAYKNLKTPLQMVCPKGHAQEQTYEEWRKYKHCKQCFATNPLAIRLDQPPKKTPETIRIIGLDLATHTSGYSVFDNDELVYYGALTVSGNDAAERIHQLITWLESMLEEWEPDYIGIEDIQLQENDWAKYNVSAFKMLANLQGAVQELFYSNNVQYQFISVSSWRNYCAIVGRDRTERKQNTQKKIQEAYGFLPTQDEADAICIGKYFVQFFRKEKKEKITWGEDI